MAWLPIVATVAGTIMQVAGQMSQASAVKRQSEASALEASRAAESARLAGEQAQQSRHFEAEQQRVNAQQEQAAAQRSALEEQRRARLVASRALAVAGASGAGVSDPSVMNLLADLEGEGAYRSALSIYSGEDRARSLRMGAASSDYEGVLAADTGRRQGSQYDLQASNIRAAGRDRASALRFGALGTLVSGGSALYTKYGMGGPGTQPPAPVEDRRPPSTDSRFFN